MNCTDCGAAMSRFRNEDGTERYACPNASGHAALLERRRALAIEKGRKMGRANRGRPRKPR